MHIPCFPNHVNVEDSEVDNFKYHVSQHYKLAGWEDL